MTTGSRSSSERHRDGSSVLDNNHVKCIVFAIYFRGVAETDEPTLCLSIKKKIPSANDKVYQFAYVNQSTGALVRLYGDMSYWEAFSALGATGVANS